MWGCSEGKVRKLGLIKRNVTGDEDFAGLEVEAPVALVFQGVSEEDTTRGSRSKFMRAGGDGVRKTKTTKNAHVVVGWVLP